MAVKIVSKFFIADAHTDFLSTLMWKPAVLHGGKDVQLNISKESLLEGNVRIQFFAAFVDATRPKQKNAALRCLQLIDHYHQMLDAWGAEVIVPLTKENFDSILAENGPIGAVLTIEGGDVIHGSLEALRMFYRMGVRVMGLTFNHSNEIGTSCTGDPNEGLADFGIECIQEMNRIGMAIDVSHLNRAGFWDAIQHSTRPIIATHSNCQAITPHVRNLDDDQIRALIQTKGYMGINLYTSFLTKEEESSLDDIIRHMNHVLSLGGEDILGFGSDFDGLFGCPKEISGAQDYPKIVQRMMAEGYSEEIINKICYQNLSRYIKAFL